MTKLLLFISVIAIRICLGVVIGAVLASGRRKERCYPPDRFNN